MSDVSLKISEDVTIPPAWSRASPRLSNRLNVFLGFHPQWGNTGVPWISWALVRGGWGAHRANVGQVRAVSQGRRVQEGSRQRRRHGRGRRRRISAREALRAANEAGERLQGGGSGERRWEPGVQLQTGGQGAAGRAAEGEQRGGRVLEFDGAHLQLLLPSPLSSPVLKPHLTRKRIFMVQIQLNLVSEGNSWADQAMPKTVKGFSETQFCWFLLDNVTSLQWLSRSVYRYFFEI